jgi:hypothetical protein
MVWTQEQKDQLRKLWSDKDNDMTAAEMGAKIGQTKNAVIGMAHRMGLPQRGTIKLRHIVRRKRRTPKAVGAAVNPDMPELEEPVPALPPETHPDPGQCKYMHGDPQTKGWQFCGARTFSSRKPFCDYHSAKLLVPNEIGKKKE